MERLNNRMYLAEMMVEFNADGSIKLPGRLGEQKEKDILRMKNERCIRVKKEIVRHHAPKECVLRIELSAAIDDARFIRTIYDQVLARASVDMDFTISDGAVIEIRIGTDFKR